MNPTPEQLAIVEHDAPEHLVVRAVPGSGKTTTLVARVEALVRRGVPPGAIQVVMFNRAVQDTCTARLAAAGVSGVRVNTFDSLAKRLLHRAIDRGLAPSLQFEDGAGRRARLDAVHRQLRQEIEDVEDIERAIDVWRAHVVPPSRARFPPNPAIVRAYALFEELRCRDGVRVDVSDLNYTALGVLRRHGRLEPAPRHLLVDEFQDVNPARVELLKHLASADTRLVAVGDEDQGINEWCGSHPRFFHEFEAQFPGLPTRVMPLSTSFRLGPGLATPANAVIAHNTARRPARIEPGGAARGELQTTPELAPALASLLAEGVAPGALAVLYRSRLEGAGVLSALARARLPVATDDAHLLRRGAGPELLRSVFRAATADTLPRPESVWALVRATCEFVRGEPFKQAWAAHGGRGLRSWLADASLHEDQTRTAVRDMAELARLLARVAACATAKQALRLVDEAVDAEVVLRSPSRSLRSQDQAIASYEALCDWIASQPLAPAEVDEAIERLDLTAGRPRAECVYANTIHKAKGLEWPVVVIAGVADGAFPAEAFGDTPGTDTHPEGIEQSPFVEQERRTFYVAATRAKERVLVHLPPGTFSTFFEEMFPPGERRPARIGATVRRTKPPSPSQGRPWSEDDDAALHEGWTAGDGLAALATRLGRSSGAVAARLVRLSVVETREEARRRP